MIKCPFVEIFMTINCNLFVDKILRAFQKREKSQDYQLDNLYDAG